MILAFHSIECCYFKTFHLNFSFCGQIDRPNFGEPDKILLQGLEHPRVKAYFRFLTDVAVIFGATKNDSERELLDVIKFEMELAKVSKQKLWKINQ